MENEKIIKSYYLCFMQVTKTHIYTNLTLTNSSPSAKED